MNEEAEIIANQEENQLEAAQLEPGLNSEEGAEDKEPALVSGVSGTTVSGTSASDSLVHDSLVHKEELASDEPHIPGSMSDLPWYVVHTYSGFEQRAKVGLEERIRARGLEAKFGDVLVPHETVVEVVKGVKKTSQKKFLPGYILVQMELNEDTWHLVKDTPKVTGFLGDERNPLPLTQAEVESVIQQVRGAVGRPRMRISFDQGDSVKVTSGPFTDFNGTVDEVKADKGKLRVLISIFGRNTPVELDFTQVEKL